MLKKCANPLCPNAFRVLSQGKLFQMEVDDFVACALPSPKTPLTTVALGTMRAAPQSHAVRRSP